MSSPTGQLAAAFQSGGLVDQSTLILRMGEVKAVHVAEGLVDVALGDAPPRTETIERVAHLSNYQPSVGDYIWVWVNGPDLLVLDRTSLDGPSVISNANSSIIYEQGVRTSTAFGDLNNAGPATATFISPSGRCLVNIGCYLANDSGTAGAAMSFEMVSFDVAAGGGGYPPDPDSGYDSPATGYSLPPSLTRAFMADRAGAGRYTGGSRTCYLSGIPAGWYVLTAKYASVGGGTARFLYRDIGIMPF